MIAEFALTVMYTQITVAALDERPIPVPAGRYDLVFQALPGATAPRGTYVARLTFTPSPTPTFAILKQRTELKTKRRCAPTTRARGELRRVLETAGCRRQMIA